MSLYLIVVIEAYLLGSIPFGFLLVWLVRKEDIRAKGSGNIGATNVLRSGAKGLGILTFVLDGSKGYAAVAVAYFLGRAKDPATLQHLAIVAALFVILGHMFPVWLRFKGGKGVATAFGAFLGLCWPAALTAFVLWLIAVGLTRYVSLGLDSRGVRASLSHSVAVAGQIRLRIRRSGLRLLLDRHPQAPAKHHAPHAGHGAPIRRDEEGGENGGMSRIAIVGSGSWGTALALSLARRGDHSIALWSHSAPVGTYLPGFPIPQQVHPVTDIAAALQGADIVISAVPSQHVRAIYEKMAAFLQPQQLIVSATKGIEDGTFLRMSQVIAQVIALDGSRLGVLSGPSFAQEVAAGSPTAVTIACDESSIANRLQEELGAPGLRIYTNDDVIGVELGGALKNVIAIAAGIAAGLELGHNSAAAIITRGVAEITRLAVACGGRRETLAGLSGLGDLVLTCTGPLSRNRSVGVELGRGHKLPAILANLQGKVAEGVRTTSAALGLAKAHSVEMPITEQMAAILEHGKSPQDAIRELMARPGRDE